MVKRRVHGTKEPQDMSHIRRIGHTLYARFTIPKDRWADCDRREVVRTLQTGDLKEARKRIGPALEAIREDLNGKLMAKGLPALSGDWVPSWGSQRGIVDEAVIPSLPDQNLYAHSRMPMDMMRQG